MTGGCRERRAAQHHLIDHELAVVLAECAGLGLITRIGRIGAAGPLPHRAERVVERLGSGSYFPFGFAWQMLAGPARKRVGFVEADMTDRQRRIDRAQAAERHRKPRAVAVLPITGRVPGLYLD